MNEATPDSQFMEFRPLAVVCPDCGSEDVIYSCHPDCCFNHVCGACLKSFELFTEDLGEKLAAVEAPAFERDSSKPTVACARCHSLEVYQLAEGGAADVRLICASCHTLLRLGITTD